jgi:hypothetical protein
MAQRAIQVACINAADWGVREEGGRELGHYPNEEEALSVGRKLAHARSPTGGGGELGQGSILARLFGR